MLFDAMRQVLDTEVNRRLSEFIECQAMALASQVGFGWQISSTAPAGYPGLVQAYWNCRTTGQALPVWVEAGPSIYTPPVQAALAYWTSILHLREGIAITLAGQLEVAAMQLAAARHAGFNGTSPEYRCFAAERIGPLHTRLVNGDGPVNPRVFALVAAVAGLANAVAMDIAMRSQ